MHDHRSECIVHFNVKLDKYLVIPIDLVDDYFNSNFQMTSPFFGVEDFKDLDKYFEELFK